MGSIIAIRVTARSANRGIGGWVEGADGRRVLEVRVAETPAGGAANDAVMRLLAKALGVSRSSVRIVSGQASRYKRIEVQLGEDEVRAWLPRKKAAS